MHFPDIFEKKIYNKGSFKHPSNVKLMEPQGYYKNIEYIKNSKIIITDSGGIQKEAYWSGKACFTLRNETEWINTVTEGWNTIITLEDNLGKIIKKYSIPEQKYRRGDNVSESKLILEKIRSLIP